MKLTVVTPTRNAAIYLEECIQSVVANRVPGVDVEHLIVDSGSVDGTLEIAGRSSARLIYVDPVNVYHSIREGQRVAMDSDIIGFLGGDDTMTPGTVAFLADWYSRRKSTWLVGSAEWVNASGESLGIYRAPPRWLSSRLHSSLGWNCLPLQSTFLTPAFFEEVGHFDTSFEYSGDYDLFARALSRRSFDRTSRTLSTIRMHPDQLSRRPDEARQAEDRRVVTEYSPRARVQRWVYRYFLKVILNASSPVWFYKKHFSSLRHRAR